MTSLHAPVFSSTLVSRQNLARSFSKPALSVQALPRQRLNFAWNGGTDCNGAGIWVGWPRKCSLAREKTVCSIQRIL